MYYIHVHVLYYIYIVHVHDHFVELDYLNRKTAHTCTRILYPV